MTKDRAKSNFLEQNENKTR